MLQKENCFCRLGISEGALHPMLRNTRTVCPHLVYSSFPLRRISSIKLIFKPMVCLFELTDFVGGKSSAIPFCSVPQLFGSSSWNNIHDSVVSLICFFELTDFVGGKSSVIPFCSVPQLFGPSSWNNIHDSVVTPLDTSWEPLASSWLRVHHQT